MKRTLTRIWTGTRALESRLAAAIDKGAREFTNTAPTQPLEIVELAVDQIASNVQPAGRGRFVFPFNRVTVTFAAASAEDRARVEAVLDHPLPFAARVVGRLNAAGCALSTDDLDIAVAFAAPDADARLTAAGPYHLALERVGTSDRAPRPPVADAAPAPRPDVWLDVIVTHGSAACGAQSFNHFPVTIGRGDEVRDARDQLIRINHVAFADAPSTSRRHARIELDASTSRLRVVDENSARGTSVIRGGRGIAVPRGSRGLTLHDGDEITFGDARVRIGIR